MNNVQIKKSYSSFLDKLKKPKPVITIWHKLIFLSPIFIIILIIKGNQWYVDYQLSYHGIETMATIKTVSSVGVRDPVEIENVAFEFTAGDSIYTGYTIAETNNNYAFAENGLPLSIGDKYVVRFVKNNPEIYKLDFNKPDVQTILHYIKIASEILFKLNYFPLNKNQPGCCFCLSTNIFRKYGFDGLAKILFHDESVVENMKYNSITHKKLMENKEVKDLIKKCKE
jgi:hypothetical protein